ncbi:amidase [Longirhabdus pacifica]|uniref:amidase n=1 Tax=Longirhabdus pacifica TaxID=2305227 RepID=UPI0010089D51|nr:amidase [Longirhabdus pacifica]
MKSIVFQSALQIGESIHSGATSAVEVAEAVLNHIQTHNDSVNAIVAMNEHDIREAAKQADREVQAGHIRSPLHGVPITIKDSYAVEGLTTTIGYEPLKHYIPNFDATIVQRLKEAGAIIVGKTNVPALLMDLQTNNTIFGRTNNPWDVTRTCGGSSGGGAAAVAAGFSYLDIGSDIGGSLRIPAHYCGVYSLRATEHAISSFGHMPGLDTNAKYRSSRHLASYGPLTRSIDDLIAAYAIIAGYDGKDIRVPRVNVKDTKIEIKQEVRQKAKALNIAWMDALPGVPVSQETKDSIHTWIHKLKAKGVKTTKLSQFPVDTEQVWETWGKMISAELYSETPALARFLKHILTKKKQKQVPTLRGTFPLTFKNYMVAWTKREDLITAFDTFIADYDMLILPVSSTVAFPHMKMDKIIGGQPMYTKDIYIDEQPVNYWQATTAHANLFNVLQNPVLTMPIQLTKAGLPLGIQCVGRKWSDMELLQKAKELKQLVNFELPQCPI